MTTDILVDVGEEYLIKNSLEGTFDVGVYNDATDGLTDTSDVGDITTEPTNSKYGRQSVTFSAADVGGDWGVDNDALFEFDFSDQSTAEDVDAAFIVVNFQATDTNDGSAKDHLLGTAAMGQTRDIGSIDTFEYQAGDLTVTVD